MIDLRFSSLRRLAGTALVVGCLLLAGCGGGSSSGNSSSASSTAATSSTAAGGASGIPQGANAGDKDSDNNGGPSDGDGNI